MRAESASEWVHGLAGVWSGDDRLAARIGDWLAALPGRWRWGVERLLNWWFGELSAVFRLGKPASDQPGTVDIAEADLLQFSFALQPEALGLVRERIALMIEERTPFAIGEVLAAYCLGTDEGAVRVMVRLVPLARVMAILPEQAVQAIRLAGDDRRPMIVPVPTDLLEATLRREREGARHRRTGITAALAFAFIAVLIAPLWARSQALAREQALMEQERTVMAPLIRRATLAKAAERAAAEAWRLKATAPDPLRVLDHLTASIGDDSFLTEFRLTEGDGTIGGFTSQASALPEPLEADPLLSKVRLTGPVARDGQDGRQRFEIAFEVTR